MKDAPGGKWLTMKTTVDSVDILAIAYKYNSKKTLFFCAPEGAGATIDGEPYITNWPDEHGNVQCRNVLRSVLCSRYFGLSNKVDRHNHLVLIFLVLQSHALRTNRELDIDLLL